MFFFSSTFPPVRFRATELRRTAPPATVTYETPSTRGRAYRIEKNSARKSTTVHTTAAAAAVSSPSRPAETVPSPPSRSSPSTPDTTTAFTVRTVTIIVTAIARRYAAVAVVVVVVVVVTVTTVRAARGRASPSVRHREWLVVRERRAEGLRDESAKPVEQKVRTVELVPSQSTEPDARLDVRFFFFFLLL